MGRIYKRNSKWYIDITDVGFKHKGGTAIIRASGHKDNDEVCSSIGCILKG